MTSRLRRNGRALLFRLLRLSALPWVVRRVLQRRRVTILVYHDPSPAVMERHLNALCRMYNVVPLHEYVAALGRGDGTKLPPRALVVTFDDGYATNFELTQLFRRFSVLPTIFVCTGLIGTQKGFWFRHVDDFEHLTRMPQDERVIALAEAGFDAGVDLAVREALSNREVEELAASADVQAHTVTHPILPRCSVEQAEAEIVQSKLELEQRFGFDVYALAYPNGEYTEREVALAQRAGYRCALAVGGGTNRRAADPYRLARIAVDDDDGLDELVVKASGVWGWLERLSGRHEPWNERALRGVLVAAVVAGLVFRLAQYVANRSLWFDEALLGLNVVNRSFTDLGRTLEYNQAAPIGFLELEKLASVVLGRSEYALRLLPLVCGLASVVLFAVLARRVLSPAAAALAAVLFACAAGAIDYASELKQYSGDVAATLVLLLFGETLLRRRVTTRGLALTALGGAGVILLSHAAVFVAGAVAFVLFVRALVERENKNVSRFAVTIPWLGIGALIALASALETRTLLRSFGPASDAYVRSGSSAHAWLNWLRSLTDGLIRSVGYHDSGIGAHFFLPLLVLGLVGLVSLALRRPWTAAMLVAPVAPLAVASALRKYPLFDRTILFLVPASVILVAEAVHAVATRLPSARVGRAVGLVAALVVVALPAAYASDHLVVPREHEEIKQGLAYVSAHWHRGDTIFIDSGAQFALRYYLQCGCLDATQQQDGRSPWHFTLAPPNTARDAPALLSRPPRYLVGEAFDGDADKYLRQIDALRGRPRVWLLATHAQHSEQPQFMERGLVDHLDRIGRRLAEVNGTGVRVLLYDLR